MARFEDTSDLFGADSGGGVFYGNITCGWCGTKYEDREDKEGNPTTSCGIGVAHLGSLEICDCCFEEVEREILARMNDILPWFIRIVAARRKLVEGQEEMLAELKRQLIS